MKLSAKQLDLLKEMANGAEVHFMPYMGRFNPHAYYSCWNSQTIKGRVTKQAEALLVRKLVKAVKEDFRGHELEITDEGKAVLQGQIK